MSSRRTQTAPRALTIAGSDSGGGAGIQADLKTFSAFGVYGMTAITAITAQNTLGVHAALELPLPLIEKQLRSVISDIGADAAKTGMLSSSKVVRLVAALMKELRIPNLVVDPVMIAKGGHPLLAEEARAAVRDFLLPLATVATPNTHEAAALTGLRVETLDEMKRAAKEIRAAGVKWVVVKGGHAETTEAIDVVYNGRSFTELRAKRITTKNTHGTGCTFSAAIAASLAKDARPDAAIAKAKDYVTQAIASAAPLGHGHGPTNHLAGTASRWR
jgi:hydroxymethylpyrimidine/phosphomethylpyrimidine kinase